MSSTSSDRFSTQIQPLLLNDANALLKNEYLPFESGYAINEDGMYHVAASTFMPHCTGKMIDWWFGYIHDTNTYKLWHPQDHVFSDWEGPRNNDSKYIGGHHLVHEYIGGRLSKLKISFKDPKEYFGDRWKEDFKKYGYSTAVCGRVGQWDPESNTVVYTGHLIHLVKDNQSGCRMRSRFWLGDVSGVTEPAVRAKLVPEADAKGLCQHATEEMAFLGSILPDMFRRYSGAGRENL
jgi:hypothetical protein